MLVVHKIDRFSRKLRITLEYFEKLGKAGVGFVSIQNEMDYFTPAGKFMLVMQGGLAELYSDNLSEETKKGLAERKAQDSTAGLYPSEPRRARMECPRRIATRIRGSSWRLSLEAREGAIERLPRRSTLGVIAPSEPGAIDPSETPASGTC